MMFFFQAADGIRGHCVTGVQTCALPISHLYNADLAPVTQAQRKWGLFSFAALWISMSACIPTYMLASSLIGGGMNWSQRSEERRVGKEVNELIYTVSLIDSMKKHEVMAL